jgi:hypothetical protein
MNLSTLRKAAGVSSADLAAKLTVLQDVSPI